MQYLTKIFIFSIIFIFCSCKNGQKIFFADWIIVDLKYKNKDYLGYLALGNIRMGDVGGVVPGFHGSEFEDFKVIADDSFEFTKRDGEFYVTIKGSNFFNDTFKVSCLNKDCCEIVLENKDKFVRCVYNSPLAPSYEQRRDCEYVK